MSLDISTLRAAVVTYLEGVLTGVSVVPGELRGVNRGPTAACVFWPGYDVAASDLSLVLPTLTVRYLPSRSKAPATSTPPDPSPVELAGQALIDAFPRSTQVGGYFLENTSVRLARTIPNYDPDLWHCDGILTAWTFVGSA